MGYTGRFRSSGTGEECARAIGGAVRVLLVERERTWVLVNGDGLFRGCKGRMKVVGAVDDSTGESGAVERRWGGGRAWSKLTGTAFLG